jgi:glutamate dehydrogenase/leucine dehydrogenase
LLVPDFIANAGGVICGAVEHQGGTKEDAFEAIDQKIRHNTTLVMEQVKQTGILPREAAVKLAKQRVEKAMKKFRLQKAIAPC